MEFTNVTDAALISFGNAILQIHNVKGEDGHPALVTGSQVDAWKDWFVEQISRPPVLLRPGRDGGVPDHEAAEE